MNSQYEHFAAVSRVAAVRQVRERQQGADCSAGYLESTASGLLFEGPRTLECYLRYTPYSESQFPLASSVYMMAIEFMPANIALFYCGGKNIGASITPDTDYHVFITYDGATARAYLNGVLVGSLPQGSYSVASMFRIGHAYYPPQGPVHFVRIYDCALSADEISKLYNDGDPAGYVLPGTMKDSTPVEIVGEKSYTWPGVDPPYSYPVRLSRILSTGSVYRIKITVSNYESGTPDFKISSNGTTKIPAANGAYTFNVQAKGEPYQYIILYAGSQSEDRRLTLTVDSIEPVGCVAEYLPQNITTSGPGELGAVEITGNNSYTWTGADDATFSKVITTSRPPVFGQWYRIEGVISNYEAGVPNVSADTGFTEYPLPQANGNFSVLVRCKNANASPYSFLFRGGPRGTNRLLSVEINSIEPVNNVASSWLDSAKQQPLNDEYLPPLLESVNAYDLTASGTPEIVYKPDKTTI